MTGLVDGLLDFFIGVFRIITSPIQALISQYFPDLNNFAQQVGPFFNMFGTDWIPFIKDMTFIPQWTFQLVFGVMLFKIALILYANVVKLVLNWYSVLVP